MVQEYYEAATRLVVADSNSTTKRLDAKVGELCAVPPVNAPRAAATEGPAAVPILCQGWGHGEAQTLSWPLR